MTVRYPFAGAAPAPGHIGPEWLDGAEDDAWSLSTREYAPVWHRDAFVGNGYIGQRVDPLGSGSMYDATSACFVHGLWGRGHRDCESLLPAPRWATLGVRRDRPPARPQGEVENYLQTLRLDTGVVETAYTWRGVDWTVDIQRDIFISRAHRNLAMLRLSVTPHTSAVAEFWDTLDGSFIADADGRDADRGPMMRLGLDLGSQRRRVELVSGVLIPAGESEVSYLCTPWSARRTVRLRIEKGVTYTMVKAVALFARGDADDLAGAAAEQVAAALRDPAGVRAASDAAWRDLWAHRVEVPHPRLQKLINASLYHLYSQLREDVPWSIGPCGISGDGYSGRVFWDADLWVLPVVALLQPRLGRSIVGYRFDTLDGARRNAREDGHEGACFAWESAETGQEWVPIPPIHHQRHVNSDVALGQWQDYLITRDENYLGAKGAEVIIESARYWASRVVHDAKKDRYELRHIYCPDEFAGIQDNNAATNWGAAWTLRRAAALAERLGRDAPVARWREIADKMYLPWDEARGIYLEFEGWSDDRVVKQTDAGLMIYPYEMPMDPAVKTRLLDYYRRKYPARKIMMSSAFDGVVDCELGRPEEAWNCLLDLLPHYRLPYLAASEAPDNECAIFTTGLGGFLQLMVMGFAGVRMHDDGLLVEPCLPAALPWLAVRGMHYAGARFDLVVRRDGEPVSIEQAVNAAGLGVYRRGGARVSAAGDAGK